MNLLEMTAIGFGIAIALVATAWFFQALDPRTARYIRSKKIRAQHDRNLIELQQYTHEQKQKAPLR